MRKDSVEEHRIQSDELAHLRYAVKSQPLLMPPEALRKRLMAAVGPQRRPALARWGLGFGMAVLAFVLLWAVVKPGVVLGWTVNGNPPAAYRIYRSPTSGDGRVLVRELEASPVENSYQYVDLFILPAAHYTYAIEGVAPDGRTVARQAVAVDSSTVLPGQLAILVASLLVGWGAVAAFNGVKAPIFAKKAYP